MVFHPRALRSRHDDFVRGISDTERRNLVGRCRTQGQKLAATPQVPTVDVFAGVLINNQDTSISQAIGPLRRRTEKPARQPVFARVCCNPLEVDAELSAFYEWVGNTIVGLLEGQHNKGFATTREIAAFYSALYMRLFRISPLDQGNLMLAEAYVCWASAVLGVAEARNTTVEVGDPTRDETDDSPQVQLRRIERDAYDSGIASAVLYGDLEPLASWFDDRQKRWQEAARNPPAD